MTAYRKKPVVIVEAIQFTGHNYFACEKFIGKSNYDTTLKYPNIKTVDGVKDVNIGYWIMIAADGELTLCSNEVFEAVFEVGEYLPEKAKRAKTKAAEPKIYTDSCKIGSGVDVERFIQEKTLSDLENDDYCTQTVVDMYKWIVWAVKEGLASKTANYVHVDGEDNTAPEMETFTFCSECENKDKAIKLMAKKTTKAGKIQVAITKHGAAASGLLPMKIKVSEANVKKTVYHYLTARRHFWYPSKNMGVWDAAKKIYRRDTWMKKGVSDITLIHNNGKVFFIELKGIPGSPQSKEQKEFQYEVEKRGHVYLLVRSIDDLVKSGL